jgi:hypothetical protein
MDWQAWRNALHLFWKSPQKAMALWRALDEYETDNKGNVVVGLKQWVRVKNHEIQVSEVEDVIVEPFRLNLNRPPRQQGPEIILDDGTIMSPAPNPDDPRILFVNVAYRNPLRSGNLDCRRNQWWLYDSEGYSYEATGSNRFLYENNGKQFLGGQRYVSPGMMVRGWLAFELGRAVMPARIQFVDGFLAGNTADFSLNNYPLLPTDKTI